MIKFDFWYEYRLKDVDFVTVSFYPDSGLYRGNLYKNNIAIGDFYSNCSVEIEKAFPGIFGK